MNINKITESNRNGRIDQGEQISLNGKNREQVSGKVFYYHDQASKKYIILIKTDKGIFKIKANTLNLKDLNKKDAENLSDRSWSWKNNIEKVSYEILSTQYENEKLNKEAKDRGFNPAKSGYTKGIFFKEKLGAIAFDKAIRNNDLDKIDLNIINGKVFVKIDGKNYEIDKKSFNNFKEVMINALTAKHKDTYYFGKNDLATEINILKNLTIDSKTNNFRLKGLALSPKETSYKNIIKYFQFAHSSSGLMGTGKYVSYNWNKNNDGLRSYKVTRYGEEKNLKFAGKLTRDQQQNIETLLPKKDAATNPGHYRVHAGRIKKCIANGDLHEYGILEGQENNSKQLSTAKEAIDRDVKIALEKGLISSEEAGKIYQLFAEKSGKSTKGKVSAKEMQSHIQKFHNLIPKGTSADRLGLNLTKEIFAKLNSKEGQALLAKHQGDVLSVLRDPSFLKSLSPAAQNIVIQYFQIGSTPQSILGTEKNAPLIIFATMINALNDTYKGISLETATLKAVNIIAGDKVAGAVIGVTNPEEVETLAELTLALNNSVSINIAGQKMSIKEIKTQFSTTIILAAFNIAKIRSGRVTPPTEKEIINGLIKSLGLTADTAKELQEMLSEISTEILTNNQTDLKILIAAEKDNTLPEKDIVAAGTRIEETIAATRSSHWAQFQYNSFNELVYNMMKDYGNSSNLKSDQKILYQKALVNDNQVLDSEGKWFGNSMQNGAMVGRALTEAAITIAVTVLVVQTFGLGSAAIPAHATRLATFGAHAFRAVQVGAQLTPSLFVTKAAFNIYFNGQVFSKPLNKMSNSEVFKETGIMLAGSFFTGVSIGGGMVVANVTKQAISIAGLRYAAMVGGDMVIGSATTYGNIVTDTILEVLANKDLTIDKIWELSLINCSGNQAKAMLLMNTMGAILGNMLFAGGTKAKTPVAEAQIARISFLAGALKKMNPMRIPTKASNFKTVASDVHVFNRPSARNFETGLTLKNIKKIEVKGADAPPRWDVECRGYQGADGRVLWAPEKAYKISSADTVTLRNKAELDIELKARRISPVEYDNAVNFINKHNASDVRVHNHTDNSLPSTKDAVVKAGKTEVVITPDGKKYVITEGGNLSKTAAEKTRKSYSPAKQNVNHISGQMSDAGCTGKSTIGENTLWRFKEQGTDINVIFNNKNEIISITAFGKLAGTTPSNNLRNFCKNKGIIIPKDGLMGTPGSLDVTWTPGNQVKITGETSAGGTKKLMTDGEKINPENPEGLTLSKPPDKPLSFQEIKNLDVTGIKPEDIKFSTGDKYVQVDLFVPGNSTSHISGQFKIPQGTTMEQFQVSLNNYFKNRLKGSLLNLETNTANYQISPLASIANPNRLGTIFNGSLTY